MIFTRTILGAIIAVGLTAIVSGTTPTARSASTATPSPSKFHAWAPTPPMGWNSWDCFGATVTEEQTKANTDYMATKLAQHGWQYIVVDIQWYEPQSTGWDYARVARPVLDENGRLWPVEAKFPTSAGGKGFKPLADYIHGKGLKFGVHLMRGIPREAVKRNTPVLGTNVRAADIANLTNTCPWNPDMYGVDLSKPGAQEYYDSVFALLATWEIDYIKVDDLSRPYYQAEVEAIRKAIDRTGRPIGFSTSPGATPLSAGPHVEQHANLWRLTDDFWDNWPLLKQEFAIVHNWTPHRGPGHWPDPDMLPLGAIHVGPRQERNWTKFTTNEQYTLMTLWSITQSPLMFGGHLPWNDAFTESLLTNDEVITVDQHGTGSRQLFRTNDLIAWVSEAADSKDRYLALFNAQDQDTLFQKAQPAYSSEVIRGKAGEQQASIAARVAGAKRLYLVVTTSGDDLMNDHADWIEPKLSGPKGELKLSELRWKSATAGYRQARVGRNVNNQPLARNGQPVAWGIGTHSPSVIEYELPEGYETFAATGVLDPASRDLGSVQFQVFTDQQIGTLPENATIKVQLADLGFTGTVKVRDLWKQQDAGGFSGLFSAEVPVHGAGLYRMSPR